MNVKTTDEVARMLNTTRRTVLRWCVLLNIPKVGNQYLLAPEHIALVKINYKARPGRPRIRS